MYPFFQVIYYFLFKYQSTVLLLWASFSYLFIFFYDSAEDMKTYLVKFFDYQLCQTTHIFLPRSPFFDCLGHVCDLGFSV